MLKVDLNCDLGESFGAYKIGSDEKVLGYISSANIACGFHAGDSSVMQKTVGMCKANGVGIGAHPGFPDLLGFGRRNMDVTPIEVKAYTLHQIGALYAFCRANGVALSHVKPHGAMYNMAAKDKKLAVAVCQAIVEFDKNLILLGLSGSEMLRTAKEFGLRYASEVFADRGYEADGSLVKRGTEGAMIENQDEAIERVILMVKEGKVRAKDGTLIDIEAHSVCLHGDGAHAEEFAKNISKRLKENQIAVTKLDEIV